MKSGFKDRTEIKSQHPKDKPVDGKDTPWEFPKPEYDQRSSCFVNCGTNYGVGVKQPVGTENITNSYAVPLGRADTMKVVLDY